MVSRLSTTTLWIIGLTAVAGWLLTALARAVAPRVGMLDKPDGRRKAHAAPMPLLGGVAVFGALAAAVGLAHLCAPGWLTQDPEFPRQTWVMLGTAALFCAVGVCDDARGMRARTKLLLLSLASLPLVLWGRPIETVHLLGYGFELGVVGAAFTVFWLVACANVINLVDGLDGLAGTIGMIVCLAFAALAEMQGRSGPAVLSLCVSAALLGFLLHNWPPAKIYLGDSGSLMIGFLIAALSIESSLKRATGFALAIPLVLVSIPVFDTSMAIVRRKLTGRGIGEADRGHIHHCLQDRGLSRQQSLLAITGLCLSMALITVVAAWTNSELAALGLCAALLATLVVRRIFGYREAVLFLHHARALGHVLADASGMARTRLLLARLTPAAAHERTDHWDHLTGHIAGMGGLSLELACRDGETDELLSRIHWEADPAPTASAAHWQFQYTIPGSGGVRATLTATGQARAKLKGQRMIDLFRMFDLFGRHWLSLQPDDAEALGSRRTQALPLRAPAVADERRAA